MKTISVYTGVSAAFLRNDLRLHYTTENACHMTIHRGTTIDMYRMISLIPYCSRTSIALMGGGGGGANVSEVTQSQPPPSTQSSSTNYTDRTHLCSDHQRMSIHDLVTFKSTLHPVISIRSTVHYPEQYLTPVRF